MKLTKKYYLLIFSAILLVNGSGITADLNNNEIVDHLLDDLVSDIQKEAQDSTVAFDFRLKDNIKTGYLKTYLGNKFRENNWNVYRNFQPDTSFQGIIFELGAFDVDILYSRPINIVGTDEIKVERTIEVFTRGQIYEHISSAILLPLDLVQIYQDTINLNIIPDVEKSPYPFMIGRMEERNKWDRYFEPMILITTVITVLILFFTQRI